MAQTCLESQGSANFRVCVWLENCPMVANRPLLACPLPFRLDLSADSARQAMDLTYRHGGAPRFKRNSRLAECRRDLHVVGQTVTIAPEWYPIGGRAYLGMDPGPRLR